MLFIVTDCNRPTTVWYGSCLLGRVQQLCRVAQPGHKMDCGVGPVRNESIAVRHIN
jgi:hypothetical protein